MSKRLLLLNVLLVSGAAVFSVQLVRTFLAAPLLPSPRGAPPPQAAGAPAPETPRPAGPPLPPPPPPPPPAGPPPAAGGGARDRRTRARFRSPRRLRRCRGP